MQEREIKQLYLHYISLDSWSLYKRISVCDRNINILHIHKYKRTPQTVGSVMWCSAASTPHILLWVSARTAGHDQVQRPISTRRTRARASSASSSSFCGSETRFSLVGRSGPACRTAPSASVCWWIRSSEIHFRVRPAAAWSRAFSSSCPSSAPCTTKHLGNGGGHGQPQQSSSPPLYPKMGIIFFVDFAAHFTN